MIASRVIGLPAHRGPLRTDGYYAHSLAISACSRTGSVDVMPEMLEYAGADLAQPAVRVEPVRGRFASWLAALWGGR